MLPKNIDDMASSLDIKYFPCSVKQNINVTEVIEYLIDTLIENSKHKKVIIPDEETPILLKSSSESTSSASKKTSCSC